MSDCKHCGEDPEYRRFVEHFAVTSGRGTVAALWIFLAFIFTFAVFAYVKHFSSDVDDFRPCVLSLAPGLKPRA